MSRPSALRSVHPVPDVDHRAGLLPALLKHWRGQRGLSQLDLALAADVSSRHVSFIETGRSTPSPEMVLRLATALDVPLRHVNALLQAAGHDPVYDEPATPPPLVRDALQLMKAHHEPFPLIVVNRTYEVTDLNRAALALLSLLAPDALASGVPPNLVRLTFSPDGAQPVIANFAEIGRTLLWRLQREVLADPDDGPLRDLLDEVLAMPTVDEGWRAVDLSRPSEPVVALHLRAGALDLRFVTMVTAFQAPQNVLVDELRIETWHPADTATADWCRQLADRA